MAQDVSVSDLNEIYTFLSSLDSFSKDYSDALYSLVSYTWDDKDAVQRILQEYQRKYNDALDEFHASERAYQEACDNAADDETGYWSAEMRARMAMLEEKQAILTKIANRLEQVKSLANRIIKILDSVMDTVKDAKNHFDQYSDEALNVIRAAADRISDYTNNK